MWEESIDLYDGDDVLSRWLEYINWIEDTYPELGEQSEMIPVLERCTRTLLNDQYRDDPRFLGLWLKYAEMCTNPLEIYKHLFNNHVGTMNSKLYIHWATYLEDLGDIDSADKVIDKGIDMGAQPRDIMKKARLHFQSRMNNKIKEQMKTVKLTEPVVRQTFGALNRVEASTGLRGLSNMQSGNVQTLKMNKQLQEPLKKPNFTVFDESHKTETKNRVVFNEDSKFLGTKPFPSEKDRFKENNGIAEKWHTHRVPQKTVTKSVKLGFNIFEDECTDTSDNLIPLSTNALKSTTRSTDQLYRNPLKFSK